MAPWSRPPRGHSCRAIGWRCDVCCVGLFGPVPVAGADRIIGMTTRCGKESKQRPPSSSPDPFLLAILPASLAVHFVLSRRDPMRAGSRNRPGREERDGESRWPGMTRDPERYRRSCSALETRAEGEAGMARHSPAGERMTSCRIGTWRVAAEEPLTRQPWCYFQPCSGLSLARDRVPTC